MTSNKNIHDINPTSAQKKDDSNNANAKDNNDAQTLQVLENNKLDKNYQNSRESHLEPPANIQAEYSLLAALLYNNRAYEKIGDFLLPFHFSNELNGELYHVITTLIDTGQLASPITVAQYVKNNEKFKQLGGADKFLTELISNNNYIINIYDFGRIIFDMYIRRCLINIGENMVNRANEITLQNDATQQLETAEQEIYDLLQDKLYKKNEMANFSDVLSQVNHDAIVAKNNDCSIVGLTTGMPSIDHALGGLHKSDLVIVAARPSMGKTSFAMRVAFNCARNHLKKDTTDTNASNSAPVGVFSLEMSSEQLVARILGQEAKIAPDKIRNGKLTNDDVSKFAEISHNLKDLSLLIDDSPALTISSLRTRARRMKRKFNIGMLVIDYLQLLQGDSSKGSMENRVNEISYITRNLKALAKELNIPVVALSQLSRAVEQRDDKRPKLSDLRESGSIEQDADVVMFIYRESYYMIRSEPKEGTAEHQAWLEQMEKCRNLAEIIIAKQRHGPIGKITLSYNSEFTIFSSLSNSRNNNMMLE